MIFDFFRCQITLQKSLELYIKHHYQKNWLLSTNMLKTKFKLFTLNAIEINSLQSSHRKLKNQNYICRKTIISNGKKTDWFIKYA